VLFRSASPIGHPPRGRRSRRVALLPEACGLDVDLSLAGAVPLGFADRAASVGAGNARVASLPEACGLDAVLSLAGAVLLGFADRAPSVGAALAPGRFAP